MEKGVFRKRVRGEREAGLTLIELLTVMFIVAVMSAMALPSIRAFLRNYTINGAARNVASQVQRARSKAVQKNVNLGVVFGMPTTTSYGIVMEDDLDPTTAPNWWSVGTEDWPTLLTLTDPVLNRPLQAQGIFELPQGLSFVDPALCGAGIPGSDWGLRFQRLGTVCQFGTAGCGIAPPNAPAYAPVISFVAGTATMCIRQTTTGLRRTITVSSGGRVAVQ